MTDDQSDPGSWQRAIDDTPGLVATTYGSTLPSVMVDLETWGTDPGCDLRSIGACMFDPVEGVVSSPTEHYNGKAVGTFYIATDNPQGYWGSGSSSRRFFTDSRPWCARKYPLFRDRETITWWGQQSEEAQGAFTDAVDLKEALIKFGYWLAGIGGYTYEPNNRDFRAPVAFTLWAHGPSFDVSILAAAYKACSLPVPWHYRAARDTRTCFDMTGIDDHSAWLEAHPGPMGVEHHALDDAICQARAVCAAFERLRSMISDQSVTVSEKSV